MSKQIHFGGEAPPKRDPSEVFDIWNTEKKSLNTKEIPNTYINP
jgi:hypothetical protein